MPEERFKDDPDLPRSDGEKRPRRPARQDDEEEEPRPRRRARQDDDDEGEDDRPRRRRIRRDDDEDESGVGGLIPYKNPQALIAYYLGVFSLIPCIGILLGIGAIILGVLGLKYNTKHPTAGGTAHAWVGIVLGTLVLLGHVGAVIFFTVIANTK